MRSHQPQQVFGHRMPVGQTQVRQQGVDLGQLNRQRQGLSHQALATRQVVG